VNYVILAFSLLNSFLLMDLTVIICTFNRAKLLELCLQSIVYQLNNQIEVLVVDNGSTDMTKALSLRFVDKIDNFRYIYEPTIGLSHARNRGINEANADWVLFLDDDAKAFPDLISRALELIKMGNFNCVGGMYYGYFEDKKPDWVSPDYGTQVKYSEILTDCPYNVPHGCIVLYDKAAVIEAGQFSPDFGMTGNTFGYAEETELQKRMENMGKRILFDPELKIHHLVQPRKLTVKGRLNQVYALGKGHKYKFSDPFLKRSLQCIRSFFGIFYRLIKYSFKLIKQKDFFWQNFIIDSIGPFLYYLGRF